MEETTVKIEKVVHGGNGLARVDRRVIFVPFTLPGESVRILVRRKYKDYLEADPIEIVEPSVDRVPPQCSYFGRCGGCHLSHASYEAQLRVKVNILKETMERNRLVCPQVEVISGPPYGYRHRARLKYSARTGALGFHEWSSHRVVDVKKCLCLTPALNDLLHRLRIELAAIPAEAVTEIECYENEKQQTAAYFNADIPEPLRKALLPFTQVFTRKEVATSLFRVKFRDTEFPMRPDIFLQVNPKLWNPMVQEVESHFSKDDVLVELYCGAGFFTIPLAQRVSSVYACEENPPSIDYARQLPARNVQWDCKKCEAYVFPAHATALLVDPPRTGLDRKVVERILRHPFRRLSYVSCDPASLARDLKLLSSRYSIRSMTLYDLFAQTYHFETITALERKLSA